MIDTYYDYEVEAAYMPSDEDYKDWVMTTRELDNYMLTGYKGYTIRRIHRSYHIYRPGQDCYGPPPGLEMSLEESESWVDRDLQRQVKVMEGWKRGER